MVVLEHCTCTTDSTSRAVIAEAVLKNVLYYFDHTKHKRKGAVICCRNFLLAVCFHKHGLPQNTCSARKLGDLTKIHRKTLANQMNNKELLRDIRYKAFVKGSPSNYLGKHAGSMLLNFFVALNIVLLLLNALT